MLVEESLILLLFYFLVSEFLVGWEASLYTIPEDGGSVEVCLNVTRSTAVQQSSPRFSVEISSGEAEGKGWCQAVYISVSVQGR